MTSQAPRDPRRNRNALLLVALALTLLAIAGAIGTRGDAERAGAEPPEPPSPTAPARLAAPLPSVPAPELHPAPADRPPSRLEYMSDGVPIMPAGPEVPRPDTFVHPHPITPRHLRIFRENALLFQLNEAVDGREPARLRALLAQYRAEYPEDPHAMQRGYALIADCLGRPDDRPDDRPDNPIRAAAQRFWDEEIASTLRRFVRRHCLPP